DGARRRVWSRGLARGRRGEPDPRPRERDREARRRARRLGPRRADSLTAAGRSEAGLELVRLLPVAGWAVVRPALQLVRQVVDLEAGRIVVWIDVPVAVP